MPNLLISRPLPSSAISSDPTSNGRFFMRTSMPAFPRKSLFRKRLLRNPQQHIYQQDSFTPYVHPFSGNTGNHDTLIRLGHASFMFFLAGITCLTDPCFFDLPFISRKVTLPDLSALLTDLDYVLISHGHRDHLDKRSVQLILQANPQVTFLVPLGMKKLLLSRGAIHIQEANRRESYHTQDVIKITFLPAKHRHRRGLRDHNRMLWGSFWIQTEKIRLYFAGDTAWDDHFEQIRTHLGPVDIACLPIGSYKPFFLMNRSHIHPEQAAHASNILDAKRCVPMHYGTYQMSSWEPASEPITWFKRLKQEGKLAAILQELGINQCWQPDTTLPY